MRHRELPLTATLDDESWLSVPRRFGSWQITIRTPPPYTELFAAAIIDGTPAEASNQLRSRDGLAGALARLATHAHYEEADLALQAAVLAHGIAETQPSSPSSKATSASRSSRCSPSWRSTAHPAPSDRSRARWLDHRPECQSTPEELADAIRSAAQRT